MPSVWITICLALILFTKLPLAIVQFYLLAGTISNSSSTITSASDFDDCASACYSNGNCYGFQYIGTDCIMNNVESFNFLGDEEPSSDETSYYAKISVDDNATCSAETAASLMPTTTTATTSTTTTAFVYKYTTAYRFNVPPRTHYYSLNDTIDVANATLENTFSYFLVNPTADDITNCDLRMLYLVASNQRRLRLASTPVSVGYLAQNASCGANTYLYELKNNATGNIWTLKQFSGDYVVVVNTTTAAGGAGYTPSAGCLGYIWPNQDFHAP